MVGAARLLNRTLVLPPLVENRWMASHKEDRSVFQEENLEAVHRAWPTVHLFWLAVHRAWLLHFLVLVVDFFAVVALALV